MRRSHSIFLTDCDELLTATNAISNTCSEWFGYYPKITKKDICQIDQDFVKAHLNLIALWSLWKIRNKMLYNDSVPSVAAAVGMFRSEITRLVRFQYKTLPRQTFNQHWMNVVIYNLFNIHADNDDISLAV
jgi:hypothetical protein